ncbi:hypothetical protein Ocin01_08958 [Orchesella cincta]|uniref:Uncharacterized protein n=1 Tax=Orchesella cincta TaxID=48709 RepID=A0A1D2MXE7_ORCCI|nr:hypothetical protein Ocin01_08958 [Orchesella cincta]
MNPQCGYYQTGQQSSYSMNSRSSNQNQRQQTYGGASYRPGSCPTNRLQPTRSRSSYGYSSSGTRAPPVFGSPSSGNIYNSNGSSWADVAKSRQNVGRSCRPPVQVPTGRNGNYQNQMAYQYQQQQQQQQQAQPQQHPLAPAPFCTPQAIKVNVTAAQLQNAKNSPIYQDRGESSQECSDVGQGAKYIQLNWQDLLGGMENMRVSMMPSADQGNQNRQLKVSFGGQKTDPPQAGETALKVVSIEPATTGRMDLQQGNAFAGAMKVCNPQQPQQLRMRPTANASQNYGGRSSYGGSCRR